MSENMKQGESHMRQVTSVVLTVFFAVNLAMARRPARERARSGAREAQRLHPVSPHNSHKCRSPLMRSSSRSSN